MKLPTNSDYQNVTSVFQAGNDLLYKVNNPLKRLFAKQGDFYLQNFELSKSLSNHLKIYIHGSQNWFQNDSRSK